MGKQLPSFSPRCRRPTSLALLVMLVCACSPGGTPAEGTDETPAASASGRSDRVLAAEVLARLAATPGIDVSTLAVEVEDGVVTVRSSGAPETAVAEAQALASRVQSLDPSLGELEAALPTQASFGAARARVAEATPGEGSGAVADGSASPSEGSSATGRPRTYVVLPGETLSAIAAKVLGDAREWPRLYEANRRRIGPDPARVRDGMELRVPQD
ncbi:MAG: hypothetical protein H6697_08700 [Myxococcales bacterium]|nr:hypothetical protein [Myxococcales bacterium]MCB9520744.1 hypothetical protein [Myxococcales bacterium]